MDGGVIAVDGESFGEELVGQNAGLGESVHSLSDLHVDIAFVDKR